MSTKVNFLFVSSRVMWNILMVYPSIGKVSIYAKFGENRTFRGILYMKFDLYDLLSSKYEQLISLILIILFSLLILREWCTLRSLPAMAISVPEKVSIPPKRDSFKEILKSSLFGVYVSNDLNTSSVKKSVLDVTLVGILFADTMNDSQVIIRSAQSVENTYRIGDTISEDAVVKRIMADGVLVERHGALESLTLPKDELDFEPVAEPLKEE